MKIRPHDLRALQEQGFISREQCDKISEYQKPAQKGSLFAFLVSLLFAVSAGLIVAGVNNLLSAYEDVLTPLEKTGTVIVQIVLAWVCWYLARKKRPVLAQAFALLAVGLWIWGVKMIHSACNLHMEAIDLMTIAFLGIVAIPFVTRQVTMIGFVAAFSFFLWSRLAYDAVPLLALYLSPNSVFLGFLLLGMFWILLSEKWRLSTGMYRKYSWISWPIAAGVILGLARTLGPTYADFSSFGHPSLFAILFAFTPLLLFALMRPRQYAPRWWMLQATANTLILLVIYFPLNPFLPEQLVTGIHLLTCVLYAAAYIACGVKYRRITWLLYATLMLYCVLNNLMSGILRAPELTSLALITGSILLFCAARKIPRIPQASHSPAPMPTSPPRL